MYGHFLSASKIPYLASLRYNVIRDHRICTAALLLFQLTEASAEIKRCLSEDGAPERDKNCSGRSPR